MRPILNASIAAFVLSTLWMFGTTSFALAPAQHPSLASSLRIDSALTFCGEAVPVHEQETRERFEKELLLTLANRAQVILWIKRSGRYLTAIEKMLRAQDMPPDLKYIAIIESALRPHVRSPRGAVGFWQFLAETGRRYGLTVDDSIDERRSIYSSTRAAILYFKDLFDRFGSWHLAAAAYNMGEEGLAAEMMVQQQTDYFRLYLPIETQRYIFRALAAKIVLSDYRKYGFDLTTADIYPPVTFDQVSVTCDQRTPLQVIAGAAGTDFKRLKDLNPHIRGHFLAEGQYTLHIPAGAGASFQAKYKEALQTWQDNPEEIHYVVKKGDNLSAIAQRFNIPLPSLLIWNRISPSRTIHPGDRLIIYQPSDVQP